jgi:hypothetical protein
VNEAAFFADGAGDRWGSLSDRLDVVFPAYATTCENRHPTGGGIYSKGRLGAA